MPLYEYECEACAHRFEVIRKFSDPPLDACTKCGGPVRKLLSSPAIQFKGSGWYITDYARKGSTDKGTTTRSEGSGGSSESSGSDSSPASSGGGSKSSSQGSPDAKKPSS